MVKGTVTVKSTSSRTAWKRESKREWSKVRSLSNQQVHVQPGKEKARENGQRYGHCQINRFTYSLKKRKQERMVKGTVTVKSTGSRTVWKRESKREWSKVWSLSNQQVHVQSGKEKARENGQRYSHCQINKFTYKLEKRKQERMVKGTVTVKSTSSHTSWKEKARENGQRYGHCQINKFTYSLEKRKQERMVKGMVTVKSTSSHTSWKRESKREWSKVWSLSNQQVHVQSGKEKARENGQRYSHCQINKFTYRLKIKKQERMIKGTVTVKSTSSRTAWKRESKREWSKVQSLSNQQVYIQTENQKARENDQRYSHCQINKFTHSLEKRKQERMVKGTVTVKSTSLHTD